MGTSQKGIGAIIDMIAANIGPGVGRWREIPRIAHSYWREDVDVVYYVGRGKFSEGENFIWDPRNNRFEFYINLQMDGFDLLTGKWFGYQLGVHYSLSTVQDFLTTPPSPAGSYEDPASPVPQPAVKEFTKGVWTFADGSSVSAVGPAQSHLVPLRDGRFVFMVTTGQTITGGTGRYEGCAGTKQATGSAIVPAGAIQSGAFPKPGLEFDACTIETFRIVKKQDIGPFPSQPPPPKEKPQSRKSGDKESGGY
ncbi:MAG TPA: hypothetical protein VFV34_02720 [Blastocatellia bacterium]|nr:hypothetical protein [Blastocatellia bacterium]